MNIFKRIATKILSSELKEKDETILSLKTANESLKDLAFGKQRVLVPRGMIEAVIKILPNPNAFVIESPSKIPYVTEYGYTLRGEERRALIHLSDKILVDGNVPDSQGVVVKVPDFNIQFTIPITKEQLNTHAFGTDIAVDTYTWNLYRAGIRMISDDDFMRTLEYLVATRNVLSEGF